MAIFIRSPIVNVSGTLTSGFVAIPATSAETESKSDVNVPDPETKSVVILKPRGEDRVRGGHPWVYKSDIADVVNPEPGAIVEVRGPRNRMLGHAMFSDQ